MSGWTVVTLRGRQGKNYEYSRWDNHNPVHAVEDLCATVEGDSRVRRWTMDSPHVYAYLACERYDWQFAETLLSDYRSMLRDAVVLGANDTTDTGTARYYPVKDSVDCTDECKETQSEDGTYVGQLALRVVGSRHAIIARDPFHDWLGEFDEKYAKEGTPKGNVE